MDITNKTRKPLSVPLPGGKKLFLGPGKSGQISAKAVDHPPLQELIDAGDIEIADSTSTRADTTGAGKPGKPTQGGDSGARSIRRTGDR